MLHPNVTVPGQSDRILVQLQEEKQTKFCSMRCFSAQNTHVLTLLVMNWHLVAYSVNSFWMECSMLTSFDSASATWSVIARFSLSKCGVSWMSDRTFDGFRLLRAANSNDSLDPLMNCSSTVDSPVQFASNTRTSLMYSSSRFICAKRKWRFVVATQVQQKYIRFRFNLPQNVYRIYPR